MFLKGLGRVARNDMETLSCSSQMLPDREFRSSLEWRDRIVCGDCRNLSQHVRYLPRGGEDRRAPTSSPKIWPFYWGEMPQP